jgi:hypothetical protein
MIKILARNVRDTPSGTPTAIPSVPPASPPPLLSVVLSGTVIKFVAVVDGVGREVTPLKDVDSVEVAMISSVAVVGSTNGPSKTAITT